MKTQLLAGAARVCINPAPDMYPIPGKITDFGLEPMQQEEPYDDMNCRALAVDNGTQRMLLLTFELAGAPEFPEYPQEVGAAAGVPADMVFIVGTHNHAAPRYQRNLDNPAVRAFAERYEKIVHDAGIAAAREAVAALRPARWGYGESLSYINTNRNLKTPGGYWVEARNLAGYSDKTLSILKFVDAGDGSLIAALLNHATHATNLYMLKDIDHKAKTSGNFTGIACRFVEQHYGRGAVALWTSGAAGDQNPFLSHGLQYEYPDGWTTQMQYPDGTGYMEMEYIGRMHGADCVRGIDGITHLRDALPLQHTVTTVELPARRCVDGWPPKDFAAVRSGGQGPRDYARVPENQLPPPAAVPKFVPDEEPRRLLLHLLLAGDTAFLFANAELFSLLGRDIRDASPYKHTVIITHHYGKKCNYIFDRTSKDVLLPMAYGGVVPGAADERILAGEQDLFDKALAQKDGE